LPGRAERTTLPSTLKKQALPLSIQSVGYAFLTEMEAAGKCGSFIWRGDIQRK